MTIPSTLPRSVRRCLAACLAVAGAAWPVALLAQAQTVPPAAPPAAPPVASSAAVPAAAPACPPAVQTPTPDELQAGLRNARDRGLLWRITKDGRSAYLYGTVHVGKLAWAFPGPLVTAALMASDTVALEIDLTNAAVMAQLAERFRAEPGALPLPAALVKRIARQVTAACLPEQALASLHPVVQAITLTVLSARWDGLDPSYAQELALAGFARAAGKDLVSLESAQAQAEALIPSDAGKALQLTEQSIEQIELGKSRQTLARLTRAWERGQLDELERYEQWCDCAISTEERAFMRKLNDDRNPALAARIDALHGQRLAVFAAVGALHMTGDQALPTLMKQRGFRVERIAFAPM